jgi:hypothetical protein
VAQAQAVLTRELEAAEVLVQQVALGHLIKAAMVELVCLHQLREHLLPLRVVVVAQAVMGHLGMVEMGVVALADSGLAAIQRGRLEQ